MDHASLSNAVTRLLDAIAALPDGWHWAWSGGVSTSGEGDDDVTAWWVTILVDRDAAPLHGHALEAELEERVRGVCETDVDVHVRVEPTTRIDRAFAIVRGHFDACAARDALTWLDYRGVRRIVGWERADDRLRVHLVVETPDEEARAADVAQRWLAELMGVDLLVAALVDVTATAH